MDDLEEMLRVLGNPTRFRIMRRLSVSPTYFLDLVRLSDSGPQAVARHLNLMERAGILRSWEEEKSNRKYFGLAKRIRIEIDMNSGELSCETRRIPKSQTRQALSSVTDSGALEELRRIDEEFGMLERRLNILSKRRSKLLRRYHEKQQED